MSNTFSRLLHFAGRVFQHFFQRNKGLLISGGVAYNTLLSIIPFCAVLLVCLTFFFEESQVINELKRPLEVMGVPELSDEVQKFWNNRHLFGIAGVAVLLFLCSLAFRMLEDAMALIFSHRGTTQKRRFWVSAIIPFGYMLFVGLGLLLVTGLSTALTKFEMVGGGSKGVTLYCCGLFGQLLMFTSIYLVMPVHDVKFRRALAGGLVATVLWEVTRRILTYWFTNLSLVKSIYGTLATGVIVLLTLEVATVIILLGAQVIAELERSADADLPWYQALPK